MDYHLSFNHGCACCFLSRRMAVTIRLSVFIRNYSKLSLMHRGAALCMASGIIKGISTT